MPEKASVSMERRQVRHLARVTLELRTPLHVGTGQPGQTVDATIVRDFNGLPAIPGSSLAGVIRQLYLERLQNELSSAEAGQVIDRLFGYQLKDKGQGSRVSFSWAYLHDADDQPVDEVRFPDQRMHSSNGPNGDPILGNALELQSRDHVKILHTGTSDAVTRAKFDEEILCAGHRFTFEMEMANPGSPDQWNGLLDTLLDAATSGRFRLGGRTRRGFGNVAITKIVARTFDLNKSKSELEAYAEVPASLKSNPDDWDIYSQAISNKKHRDGSSLEINLELTPTCPWMFGGGLDLNEEEEANLAPIQCPVVANQDDGAQARTIYQAWVVPGSSVKGALAHRVAFHANLRNKAFADQVVNGTEEAANDLEGYVGAKNETVLELFGDAQEGDAVGGRPGRVYVDDVHIRQNETNQGFIRHVSIDRFTSGAITGALFSERPHISGSPITISLVIRDRESLSRIALQSLQDALIDLCQQRLALGGGSGRGLGYFKGDIAPIEEIGRIQSADNQSPNP